MSLQHPAEEYNSTWFDTNYAYVRGAVAHGITTKDLAKALETAGIHHLNPPHTMAGIHHTLHVGVNVKDTDDVPHRYCILSLLLARRPSTLCVVPVVRIITTQAEFKAEHLSEYKLKNLGVPTLMQQREAAGLPIQAPDSAPRTYHRAPASWRSRWRQAAQEARPHG